MDKNDSIIFLNNSYVIVFVCVCARAGTSVVSVFVLAQYYGREVAVREHACFNLILLNSKQKLNCIFFSAFNDITESIHRFQDAEILSECIPLRMHTIKCLCRV